MEETIKEEQEQQEQQHPKKIENNDKGFLSLLRIQFRRNEEFLRKIAPAIGWILISILVYRSISCDCDCSGNKSDGRINPEMIHCSVSSDKGQVVIKEKVFGDDSSQRVIMTSSFVCLIEMGSVMLKSKSAGGGDVIIKTCFFNPMESAMTRSERLMHGVGTVFSLFGQKNNQQVRCISYQNPSNQYSVERKCFGGAKIEILDTIMEFNKELRTNNHQGAFLSDTTNSETRRYPETSPPKHQ